MHAGRSQLRFAAGNLRQGQAMRNEFTAVIEGDGERLIAHSPEGPGANGQGRSRDQALKSLSEAIKLIPEDRREDGLRGLPDGAERVTVAVG